MTSNDSRNGEGPAEERARGGLLQMGQRAIRSAWRGWSRARKDVLEGHLSPDLPDDDVVVLRRQINACLAAKGGEVSARTLAADIGRAYLLLSETGKLRFFSLLGDEYGAVPDEVRRAARGLSQTTNESEFRRGLDTLRAAMEPPRLRLLKQFNSLEEGVKFLVDLRADLIALAGARMRKDIGLRGLGEELRGLLTSWFDVGFLELTRVTWDAPAALLEKLVEYEAVHEISSWADLKNRLDSDRRCYAFFHPSMPHEPLIFVEIALVSGIADQVQNLLDQSQPADDPTNANTAIFYSISNAQQGLAGVSFGDFLIKQVVQTLSHDLPKLKTFATLSPIPGFGAWMGRLVAENNLVLEAGEAEAIGQVYKGGEPVTFLLGLFERRDWVEEQKFVEAVKPALMRLGALYLQTTRLDSQDRLRTLDPVAHFHLTNGARIERLNWMGDVSRKGLHQSAGLMVNYLYKLNDIERNHDNYTAKGNIRVSNTIKALG